MAKPGRRKEAGAGKDRPTSWSLLAIAVVVLAAIAYTSLHPKTDLRKKPREQEDASTRDIDDKLEIVRKNLMDPDKRVFGLIDRSDNGSKDASFADHGYWEERYAKQAKPYDWYGTWNTEGSVIIKPHVQQHLPAAFATSRVLNIGCGSSRMAHELITDGFGNIMNVDISHAVIESMKQKFEGNPGVRFDQMDVTKLTFADSSFDIIFDKGTLDALYTGSSESVQAAVSEVFRVLSPGAIFVSVSFGTPGTRRELNMTSQGRGLGSAMLNSKTEWAGFQTIALRKDGNGETPLADLEDSEHFFVYIMTKHTVPG